MKTIKPVYFSPSLQWLIDSNLRSLEVLFPVKIVRGMRTNFLLGCGFLFSSPGFAVATSGVVELREAVGVFKEGARHVITSFLEA